MCLIQALPIVDLVRGIPCAVTKRRHLRKALLQYMDEFDTCRCAPCPNNARPVLSGTECKCVCQTGTFGRDCEKRAPDFTSGNAALAAPRCSSLLLGRRQSLGHATLHNRIGLCLWKPRVSSSCGSFLLGFHHHDGVFFFPTVHQRRGGGRLLELLGPLEQLWSHHEEASHQALQQPCTNQRRAALQRC